MSLRTGFKKSSNRQAAMTFGVEPYPSKICHLDSTVESSIILNGNGVQM